MTSENREIKIYADWLGMDEPKLIGDLRSERVSDHGTPTPDKSIL